MKTLLIATTALIGVASIALTGSAFAREPTSSDYQRDANNEFLCTYGYSVYTKSTMYESSVRWSWVQAAVPIIGNNKTVKEIIVEDAPQHSQSYGFSVAIHRAYKQIPGRRLAGAYAYTSGKCGRTHVSIDPVKLKRGEKYWVVETALRPGGRHYSSTVTNGLYWLYDQNKTKGALWQSGRACSSSCSFHSHNHWEPISGGVPFVRVR